jgi:hypothetical protein
MDNHPAEWLDLLGLTVQRSLNPPVLVWARVHRSGHGQRLRESAGWLISQWWTPPAAEWMNAAPTSLAVVSAST